MDALSKIGKAGMTMGSYELNNIYKDPPRSYITKYKQKIDDSAARDAMEESVGDRFESSISHIPRGINVFQDVSYSNHGNGANLTSLHSFPATNPIKAQVVRPPIIAPSDMLPLSRQKRSLYTQITNPNASIGQSNQQFHKQIDSNALNKSVQNKLLTMGRPVASIRIDLSDQSKNRLFDKFAVKDDITHLTANSNIKDIRYNYERVLLDPNTIREYVQNIPKTTNVSTLQNFQNTWNDQQFANYGIKDITLLKSLTPNFGIVIYDSNTHDSTSVSANIKDSQLIALTSAAHLPIHLTNENGEKIKLSNYRAKVVQSAAGTTNLQITSVQPTEMVLNRNTPLYFVNTSVQGSQLDQVNRQIDLQRNLPEYNVQTAFKAPNTIDALYDNNIILERNLPEYNAISVANGYNGFTADYQNDDELQLKRRENLMSIQSGISAPRTKDHMLNDSVHMPRTRDSNNYSASTNVAIQNAGRLETKNADIQLRRKTDFGEFQNTGYIPTLEKQNLNAKVKKKMNTESLSNRYI